MVFGKNSSTTKAHGMPFSPSAQYAKNVGTVIQCLELIYVKFVFEENLKM